MFINKRMIYVAIVLLLITTSLVVVGIVVGNQRTITVKTDTTPIKLELGDTSYTINKKEQTINVAPELFTYRAIAKIDGKQFALVDKIDLTETKSVTLNLAYNIYSKQYISNILCKNTQNNCPFVENYLSVVYEENYQWAVVSINNPTLGKAKAVLNIDSGKWKIIDGPGTDIQTTGYYPQSVEEAIKNGQ